MSNSMWCNVLAALTLAGHAAAAPTRTLRSIDLGPTPMCRQISRTYGDVTCCDSCAAPYLLDTGRWVEISEVDVTQHRGGGQLEVDLGSGTNETVDIDVDTNTVLESFTTANVPCGACVTSDSCIADKSGVVNTWHRLCQRAAVDTLKYMIVDDEH